MTIQAFVDVLNELQELEIDRGGGEDAYILVKNTPEVQGKLATVGVTEQEIKNVGDDESFCLLALAFSKYPGQLEYDGAFRLANKFTIKQLYDTQHITDKDIIKDKGLEGQDLLPNTVLALQVEVAELANEWRGFKHWSNDQEPNTINKREKLMIDADGEKYIGYEYYNPLLEEYADCLCFFLSIARQIGLPADVVKPITQDDIRSDASIVELMIVLFSGVSTFITKSKMEFLKTYSVFREIGDRLGLTWDQIATAYMEKNKINHERLANGY